MKCRDAQKIVSTINEMKPDNPDLQIDDFESSLRKLQTSFAFNNLHPFAEEDFEQTLKARFSAFLKTHQLTTFNLNYPLTLSLLPASSEIILAQEPEVDINRVISTTSDRRSTFHHGRLLHSAAQSGCANAVRQLCDMGADVSATNYHGETAMHLAARLGYVDIINLLVEYGANIHPVSHSIVSPRTPINVAAANGQNDTLLLLHHLGAPLEAQSENDYSAMHRAAETGQSDTLKLLKELGANINARGPQERMPIHMPCWINSNDNSAMLTLVQLGADITARSTHESYPIFGAMAINSIDTVQAILKRGFRLTPAADFAKKITAHFGYNRKFNEASKFLLFKFMLHNDLLYDTASLLAFLPELSSKYLPIETVVKFLNHINQTLNQFHAFYFGYYASSRLDQNNPEHLEGLPEEISFELIRHLLQAELGIPIHYTELVQLDTSHGITKKLNQSKSTVDDIHATRHNRLASQSLFSTQRHQVAKAQPEQHQYRH